MAKRSRKRSLKLPVELPADVVRDMEESIRILVDLTFYFRASVLPNPFEELAA